MNYIGDAAIRKDARRLGQHVLVQNWSERGVRVEIDRVETAWYRNRAIVSCCTKLTRVKRQRIGTIAAEIPV